MNERASPSETNESTASNPPTDIEVLLVEDDPDDVMVMTRALFSSEFQVGLQVASNGQEGLDLLRKKGRYADAATPNLVLLDLNMPIMNGQEFLEEVRKDPCLHSIPVIVITTSDEPDVVREAYRFGANSVVTKATSIAGMTELMRLVTHYWFKTSRVFMVD